MKKICQNHFRQTLKDIVTFKRDISKTWGLTGPWIIFGCSYAGSLATWLKKVYPNDFAGAVASSAPIFAKVIVQMISILLQNIKLKITFLLIKLHRLNKIYRLITITTTMLCLKYWTFVILDVPINLSKGLRN